MPEKSNVLKQYVKHKGYFNYTELYDFIYLWLRDNNYIINEEQYSEKMTQTGKEVKIKWVVWKKISDYFKEIVEMKWHIIGMNDAEIEIDGKKMKTNKGEIKITFTADLEKDYEARWEDKPIWKFLRGVYDKYIIRTTTEEYEIRLINHANSIINEVKGFLQLEGKGG